MVNDYLEAIEQLIDAIDAKIATYGDDAPASTNLRKDAGVIEPCTLRELLGHVQASLDKVDAMNSRVKAMLAAPPSAQFSPRPTADNGRAILEPDA